MKLPYLLILVGAPGSGKSTEALNLVKKGWLRVSRDDIRQSLGLSGTPDDEKILKRIYHETIRLALASGRNVVADATHARISRIEEVIANVGDCDWNVSFITTDLDLCIKRNSLRESPVPKDRLVKMWNSCKSLKDEWKNYEKELRLKYTYDGQYKTRPVLSGDKWVICDLDGTLALPVGRNPYDGSKCEDDELNIPVYECLKSLQSTGINILFFTGRDEAYRLNTEIFLAHKCPDIKYELIMRKSGDNRPDYIIKEEMWKEANKNILFVLDDRRSVVNMWRRQLGIVCFAVADGDF